MEFNKTTLSLLIGGSEILTITVLPAYAYDKTITYTSSDPTIANVDTYGRVNGLKLGKTIIRATTINGLTASCEVTVELKTPTNLIVSDVTSSSAKVSWENG